MNSLRTILSLSDVLGPGHVCAPRAHSGSCRWVCPDAALTDGRTAQLLCVAGTVPVVCSVGAVRPAGLELIAEAGLIAADCKHVYRDEREYLEITNQLARQGNKVMLQHLHPPGVIPDEAIWIKPSLLSCLNNKANLLELAPAKHVPPRKVLSYDQAFGNGSTKLPTVIKVATDWSTGGGTAVAVCRSDDDLANAGRRFSGCERVVVESFLDTARSPCLNYAVMHDGEVKYLGYADQDVTPAGEYRGNWLQLGSKLPSELIEIGTEIARRGSQRGYRGFVGIDFALLADDRIMVLDLTFRLNGSTVTILLAPAIARERGAKFLHLRKFVSHDGYEKMISAAQSEVRRRRLLPLATFDPQIAGHANHPAQISGVVLGDSPQDIRAVEAEMSKIGLK